MGSQVPSMDELDTYLDEIFHDHLTQWLKIFFMLTILYDKVTSLFQNWLNKDLIISTNQQMMSKTSWETHDNPTTSKTTYDDINISQTSKECCHVGIHNRHPCHTWDLGLGTRVKW
jgi:hypothetical protein